MNVLLTIDTEIWCGGWSDLNRKFPDAFSRYVYGRSRRGDYALPMILRVLRDHGLRATFFVEPLFAFRFGLEPLREIVGMIKAMGQDIQLHLHPEWVDEARPSILPGVVRKRQHLFEYSLEEQTRLIELGCEALRQTGADEICAFRAGGFSCSRATLRAVDANRIVFDSSVNPSVPWSGADLSEDERGQRLSLLEGVLEYPISVFFDRPGHRRHVQVGSSSLAEMTYLLEAAREQGRSAFVILLHNFELLIPGRCDPDPVVVRRFLGLCKLLDKERKSLRATSFRELDPKPDPQECSQLRSSLVRTAMRTVEQAWRRIY